MTVRVSLQASTEHSEIPAWEDPRRALARHGLVAKRSFSQNFLVARSIVEGIADAVGITPGAPVVELGPGLGTLTCALLRRGASLLAIERDRDMIAVLQSDVADAASPLRHGQALAPSASFVVEEGDATDIDLTQCQVRLAGVDGPKLRVVGNLPYSVTGSIFRNLIAHRDALDRVVVMIQREVRDRIVAQPGTKEYGTLTVFLQASFRIESVLKAPAGAFHPAPKVDSAVVRLTPRANAIPETDALRTIVRSAFEQRRKTFRNGLVATIGGERADAILLATTTDGRRRGETLTLDEMHALAQALETLTV